MAPTGSLTSRGGGSFLWSLGYRRMSYGDGFQACSPVFEFSGSDCRIHLWKDEGSCLVEMVLFRFRLGPPTRFSLEFELLADGESASGLCSVTDWYRSGSRVGGAVRIVKLLKKQRDGPTFVGDLALQFRVRTEPRGAGAEELEEAIKDLVGDSENESAGAEAAEGDSEGLEKDSENESLKKLQDDLEKLLSSETDSDVTLKVGDRRFPAHRNLLRARSPVFEAMFTHDMVERRDGDVTIGDCDPETFPDFLRYLYTGSTEHVSRRNVCQLYTASDKYEVLLLKRKCVEFMKSHVAVETFCDTITLALKHAEEGLLRSATEFFCANAADIAKTAKWQTFLAENPVVGNELFLKSWQRK